MADHWSNRSITGKEKKSDLCNKKPGNNFPGFWVTDGVRTHDP